MPTGRMREVEQERASRSLPEGSGGFGIEVQCSVVDMLTNIPVMSQVWKQCFFVVVLFALVISFVLDNTNGTGGTILMQLLKPALPPL